MTTPSSPRLRPFKPSRRLHGSGQAALLLLAACGADPQDTNVDDASTQVGAGDGAVRTDASGSLSDAGEPLADGESSLDSALDPNGEPDADMLTDAGPMDAGALDDAGAPAVWDCSRDAGLRCMGSRVL